MFKNLPEDIQSEIIRLLEMNDFRAAKALYDAWAKEQQIPQSEDAINT